MLALLRYRHIPHEVIWGNPGARLEELGITPPKITFEPTFLFQDDKGSIEAVCDSTPIIRRLENSHARRSVIPADPALAFIDYLLEDFGDEWCTKYMFHYRWHREVDANNAATILVTSADVTVPADELSAIQKMFKERQVGRLHVVGSNATTTPIIEASYIRLLKALERHFEQQPFLLGRRPGAGDFAIYGQFSQLVGYDPTPRAIAHEVSARTVGWVNQMEDESGLDPRESDWASIEQSPDSLRGLLGEIGRVYVPAQLANAEAVRRSEKTWEAKIDGASWTQRTFPYQAKCLRWINQEYRALGDVDQGRVDRLLGGTGCEKLLNRK